MLANGGEVLIQTLLLEVNIQLPWNLHRHVCVHAITVTTLTDCVEIAAIGIR